VFMIKLKELLWDIVQGKRFGETISGEIQENINILLCFMLSI